MVVVVVVDVVDVVDVVLTVCINDVFVDIIKQVHLIMGGRVHRDTTPGPVPVYKAPIIPTHRQSTATAQPSQFTEL